MSTFGQRARTLSQWYADYCRETIADGRKPHGYEFFALPYPQDEREWSYSHNSTKGDAARLARLRESKAEEPAAVEAEPAPKRAVRRGSRHPDVQATRRADAEAAAPGAALTCRYCGSEDIPPSFAKRRDRRCRKCFRERYAKGA